VPNTKKPFGQNFKIVCKLNSANLMNKERYLLKFNNSQKKYTSCEFMQIHDFQEMMKLLYFKRDSERGVNGTFNWLVDEVTELGEELKGTNREATEKEFADVIAWLSSLANIMGIDLEKAALNKYNNKCPKCQSVPCQCTF
jgi:NTP pyrophosphatase (non-canonical NTP hydrolase)